MALFALARGVNSCQTVGASNPLSRFEYPGPLDLGFSACAVASEVVEKEAEHRVRSPVDLLAHLLTRAAAVVMPSILGILIDSDKY
jgi:hypothetical protein